MKRISKEPLLGRRTPPLVPLPNVAEYKILDEKRLTATQKISW